MLEQLEPRIVLSAEFASAGLAYGVGVASFITEGTIDDGLETDGRIYISDFGGQSSFGDLRYDRIYTLSDGRYEREPDVGINFDPTETNGAQFLIDDGYRAGWFYAEYETPGQEVEFIVQRPGEDVDESDFSGSWYYTAVGHYAVDNAGFFNSSGRMTVDGDEVVWRTDEGYELRFSSDVDDFDRDGHVVTEDGDDLYLNADGSVIVFANTDSSDRETYAGVAVPVGQSVQASDVTGGYHLLWTAAGPFFGLPGFAQIFLEIETDGDYKLYDLDAYDDGERDVIGRGFWSIDGDMLELEDEDGNELVRLGIGVGGDTLVPMEYEENGLRTAVAGLATRAEPSTEVLPDVPILNHISSVENGRPVLYELVDRSGEQIWLQTDLLLAAGGPTPTDVAVSWIEPTTGRSSAAALSDSGLILYEHADDGTWTQRDLTADTAGQVIVGDLELMIAPDGLVSLVGLTDNGDLVRYWQNGGTLADGLPLYVFTNLETNDLAPVGLSTPAFEGDLIAYATSWGGLNVAGLDADGTIWSVWWAPGLDAWTVSDLTTTYGAQPLAGGLTVYLTSWDGINLAGIDEAGALRVTWWVPSLGGDWQQANLTEEAGGPMLEPTTVTSYVSSWGGLNVAGLNTATGDAEVYWWSPERSELGWTFSTLQDALDPSAPALTEDLRGLAGDDGSLNLFGSSADHTVRYFWLPTSTGEWDFQDLTVIALDTLA